jgi:Ca2+:H+ antiporter
VRKNSISSIQRGISKYLFSRNIVQLITSILLLRNRQIETLKTSLLGGIVSLLLLVTGASYAFGGIHNRRTGTAIGIEQDYNTTAVKMMGDLLTLISISILIPTASHILSGTTIESITRESRGSSAVLILVYGFWLLFELRTHANIFVPETFYDENEEVEKKPNLWGPSVMLVITTTLIAFNTNFAINSIDGLIEQTPVPKSFIGFILLPILNNDTTAVSNAMKDKMDLVIHSCIGKSLQITLLFVPMMVLIAWIMGIDEMNLLFDNFQVVTFALTVILITHITADGKSNW